MTDPQAIADGLSEAQRRFLRSASKRPKKWMAIRRHAKLPDTVPVHRMYGPLRLVEPVGGFGVDKWKLTELGLSVRAILAKEEK